MDCGKKLPYTRYQVREIVINQRKDVEGGEQVDGMYVREVL